MWSGEQGLTGGHLCENNQIEVSKKNGKTYMQKRNIWVKMWENQRTSSNIQRRSKLFSWGEQYPYVYPRFLGLQGLFFHQNLSIMHFQCLKGSCICHNWSGIITVPVVWKHFCVTSADPLVSQKDRWKYQNLNKQIIIWVKICEN